MALKNQKILEIVHEKGWKDFYSNREKRRRKEVSKKVNDLARIELKKLEK